MKFIRFKTLNFDSFSKEAKKCLSPASKKISLYYINSNINTIKSTLEKFNKKYSSERNKNSEIIEMNSLFKKYMDKYYDYKKYFKEKDKHKIKKKSKSTIDLIVDNYIKKGYKIPNLEKNIFHVNPLNDTGKTIQKYFNEYIHNNKDLVTSKEKNFFYLNKIGDCIKNQKFKEKKNLEMILNFPNNNNFSENNKIDNNYSNIFLKNYFNNIKKNETLEEKIKINFENDENFLKLNEYEQKNIKQLIKDDEENKKYKTFIENVLKDKKYFNTIDSDDIELDKKIELKTLNPTNHKSKKSLKLKITNGNNYNKGNNINFNNNNNSDDSSFISENDDEFKEKPKGKRINKNKKLSTKLFYNNKISNFKMFNFPQKKNNIISINKKAITQKDITNINPIAKSKKLSFSLSKEEIDDSINKKIKRNNETKKTHLLPGNKYLKKFNLSPKFSNKIVSKFSKEKSLNFLFNKINKGKIPDKKTLVEYKNYFMRKKNMSENDLNEFINRDYEPKDFYNLVNSVNMRIQTADVENKWKKNFLKIGKLQERKNILEEEKKQDNFIRHLLHYFILAKYGKIKLYEFQ